MRFIINCRLLNAIIQAMAQPEIANYIRQALAQGMSEEQIVQQLTAAGWSQVDVQNATQSMQMMRQAQAPKPTVGVGSKIGALVQTCLRLVYVLLALVLLARFFASFALLFAKFDVRQFPAGQVFDSLSAMVIISPLTVLGQLLEKLLTTYNLNYFKGLDLTALLTLSVYGVVYLVVVKIVQKIVPKV